MNDTNLSPVASPVRRLTCTCCGESFQGRQFHNQDLGYGMGECCAERVLNHHPFGHESMGIVEFERSYGLRGYHFDIPQTDIPQSPAAPAQPIGFEMADGICKALFGEPVELSPAGVVELDAWIKKAETISGFDYKNQAWVKNGRYVSCAHVGSCPGRTCDTCYGTLHAGELIAPGAEEDIH